MSVSSPRFKANNVRDPSSNSGRKPLLQRRRSSGPPRSSRRPPRSRTSPGRAPGEPPGETTRGGFENGRGFFFGGGGFFGRRRVATRGVALKGNRQGSRFFLFFFFEGGEFNIQLFGRWPNPLGHFRTQISIAQKRGRSAFRNAEGRVDARYSRSSERRPKFS